MKSLFGLVGLGLLAAVATGCGGAAKAPDASYANSEPRAPQGGYPRSSNAKSAEAAPASAGAASVAPAPYPMDQAEQPKKSEAQRQGLGTEWGESRESRIYHTSFERDDARRPWATFAIQYNDKTAHDRDLTTVRNGQFDVGRGLLSVAIVDGDESPFQSFVMSRGADRGFVLGRAGDLYTIVVRNHSDHRFELVASVDGLDVVDGKDADYSHRGYIVRPHDEVRIDGFRQSMSQVAAFRFGTVADSYAAQTGSARNVGVIGLALFAERGDRFYDAHEQQLRDTANPFPGNDGFAKPPRR
jgi:hypothetical protein